MRNVPFNGTWKLNVAKSTFTFPAPRSVLLDIKVAGDSVILAEESISAEGVVENIRIEAQLDDEVYPVIGASFADGFAVRSISADKWATRVYKSGKKIFSALLVCSNDGRSFREEVAMADGTGSTMSVLYERCSKGSSTNPE